MFDKLFDSLVLNEDFDFRVATIGMCGEAGEFANLVKKFYRDGKNDYLGMREELADVQIYLMLLSKSLNINLMEAVSDKLEKNEAKRKQKNYEYHRVNINKQSSDQQA